ncbi:hypothetical protein BJ508DRAFT_331942 [Ascobolus immersus RN42]|uniref:Uncharacterized protein n=1 Tax=Ascobolus immersus RN42 TaxID=1160509 RepID=A0A3N4HRM3_ASCIM|nr:hypothetical protein BJ508DRAFT_331942 [Ascobolus immersus RN42]
MPEPASESLTSGKDTSIEIKPGGENSDLCKTYYHTDESSCDEPRNIRPESIGEEIVRELNNVCFLVDENSQGKGDQLVVRTRANDSKDPKNPYDTIIDMAIWFKQGYARPTNEYHAGKVEVGGWVRCYKETGVKLCRVPDNSKPNGAPAICILAGTILFKWVQFRLQLSQKLLKPSCPAFDDLVLKREWLGYGVRKRSFLEYEIVLRWESHSGKPKPIVEDVNCEA